MKLKALLLSQDGNIYKDTQMYYLITVLNQFIIVELLGIRKRNDEASKSNDGNINNLFGCSFIEGFQLNNSYFWA